MPSLILLRGLPGSGKTSLAKVLSDDGQWPVFSVDSYFTDPDTGEYRFEFDKNHLAYKACLQNTEEAMKQRTEKIFIDNTLTIEWEIEPYFQLASAYNYTIFVATVENRHKGKNTHDISEDQLERMAAKYKVVLK
jgi:predicted kinase